MSWRAAGSARSHLIIHYSTTWCPVLTCIAVLLTVYFVENYPRTLISRTLFPRTLWSAAAALGHWGRIHYRTIQGSLFVFAHLSTTITNSILTNSSRATGLARSHSLLHYLRLSFHSGTFVDIYHELYSHDLYSHELSDQQPLRWVHEVAIITAQFRALSWRVERCLLHMNRKLSQTLLSRTV